MCRQLLRIVASDIRAWIGIWEPHRIDKTRVRPKDLSYLWNYCGLRATFLYRVSHELWRRRVRILPLVISRLNITLHGFDVPPSVEIGPGLYVPHPVGTVVMAEKIGANVTLVSGITVGLRTGGSSPILEDGVFIGAGARVLGPVTVGAGAKIGANAVVMSDVPSGATAVGVPAKIIRYGSSLDTKAARKPSEAVSTKS